MKSWMIGRRDVVERTVISICVFERKVIVISLEQEMFSDVNSSPSVSFQRRVFLISRFGCPVHMRVLGLSIRDCAGSPNGGCSSYPGSDSWYLPGI